MNSSSRIRSTYSNKNKASLIQGGSDYFRLLEKLIDEALYSIQLQVYIFEEDETGKTIAEKLISAAQRGIHVQVLMDGYASRSISNALKKRMREYGIMLRFFEPILKSSSFYFGRRLHHKVFVADAYKSLVGGINISDRYNDTKSGAAWLDWAVYMEGQVSTELFNICNKLYAKSENNFIETPLSDVVKDFNQQEQCAIRIRRNDWVMNMHQISASYMEMLKNAQHEVIIMSSYFIPGRFFRKQIERAIQRGISIRVILAGMSDVGISKNAEKYFYRWALRNGIGLYEYQINILHGKIAVSDRSIATIGSYNINDISALASIELNVDIADKTFSSQVKDKLEFIISNHCKKVEPKINEKESNWGLKFIQWLSFEFYRMTFTLFTFYFKKRRKNNPH